MRKTFHFIISGRAIPAACWLACVLTLSFYASLSKADPPEKVTIEQERQLLLGKWEGVTYDMNGKVDQKLGKREAVEMEFTLQKGFTENGVIVSFKSMGIRGLPFSHPVGVGGSRGGIGTIVQQDGLSIVTLEGSKYTSPDYIAYKVQGDSLTVMPHLDPEDSAAPSLTTEKGDDRIVFHFQRKKDGKKTNENPSKTEESKQDKQSSKPLTIEALYGVWEGKTYERDGKKPRPFKNKQKSTLTLNESIEAFELVFSELEQRKMRGSSSHAADFTSSPMRFYRVTGGDEPRKDLIAIFHLEGDSLVWCWVAAEQEADGKGTPLELLTRPNDLRTVIHYVRKKQ